MKHKRFFLIVNEIINLKWNTTKITHVPTKMVECVNVEENVNVGTKSKKFKSLPSLIKDVCDLYLRALNINAIELYYKDITNNKRRNAITEIIPTAKALCSL